MKVKICGITLMEDALSAADAGAWGVGFVFYPKSPRMISPEAAGRISEALPVGIERVGVFVNESVDEISRVAKAARLTRIQLHGDEGPEVCASLDLPVMKAFRDAKEGDLRRYAGACKTFLLDSPAPAGVWGGVGKRVETGTVERFRSLMKQEAVGVEFFIAGGVDPQNVAQIVAAYGPDGIDVSSGVEDTPGIKNDNKIRALFRAVRQR